MPTISEWISWRDAAIITAKEFLAAYPYTQGQFDKAISDLQRVRDYDFLVRVIAIAAYPDGSIGKIKIDAAVASYLSNPVSDADKIMAHYLLDDQDEWTPSIYARWQYHQHVLYVDAIADTSIKEVELQEKDRRGCYKRGMIVAIMPDGHPWGSEERLPKFVVIKIPGISVEKVQTYIQPHMVQDGFIEDGFTPRMVVYRCRNWIIRWADLPAAARTKLANQGELIIRTGTYTGTADYTWAQIRNYFRNQETMIDETGEL